MISENRKIWRFEGIIMEHAVDSVRQFRSVKVCVNFSIHGRATKRSKHGVGKTDHQALFSPARRAKSGLWKTAPTIWTSYWCFRQGHKFKIILLESLNTQLFTHAILKEKKCSNFSIMSAKDICRKAPSPLRNFTKFRRVVQFVHMSAHCKN